MTRINKQAEKEKARENNKHNKIGYGFEQQLSDKVNCKLAWQIFRAFASFRQTQ